MSMLIWGMVHGLVVQCLSEDVDGQPQPLASAVQVMLMSQIVTYFRLKDIFQICFRPLNISRTFMVLVLVLPTSTWHVSGFQPFNNPWCHSFLVGIWFIRFRLWTCLVVFFFIHDALGSLGELWHLSIRRPTGYGFVMLCPWNVLGAGHYGRQSLRSQRFSGTLGGFPHI